MKKAEIIGVNKLKKKLTDGNHHVRSSGKLLSLRWLGERNFRMFIRNRAARWRRLRGVRVVSSSFYLRLWHKKGIVFNNPRKKVRVKFRYWLKKLDKAVPFRIMVGTP